MENKKTHTQYNSVEVLILIISTAIVCFIFGCFINSRFNLQKNISSTNIESNNELSEVYEVYEKLINNYYGTLDKEKIKEAMIEGMLNSTGDKNTAYITDEQSNNFNAILDGSYNGVGISVTSLNDSIVISQVFKNTPAEEAGLKVYDIIKKINEHEVTGESLSQAVAYIKEKDSVTFTILRDAKEQEVTINLRTVVLDSVASEVIEENSKKIGYIYISVFAINTGTQFNQHLQKLEEQNIDSLIIDVRYNSGGHLTAATEILSMFLDSSHVIYQMQGKDGITKYNSTGTQTKTIPLVVLVNGQSASASEILAAALKEQYGAKLVGEKTFGKGTVQELMKTSEGKQYKITTQNWLTSNGDWINENGVDVDYKVEIDLNQDVIVDSQLEKAIEILK